MSQKNIVIYHYNFKNHFMIIYIKLFLLIISIFFAKIINAQTFIHTDIYKSNFYTKSGNFTDKNYEIQNYFDVNFYHIDLEMTNQSTFISGSTTIKSTVIDANLDSVFFELTSLITIDSILLDGVLANYIHNNDELYVYLASPMQVGDIFSIQVFYHGEPGGSGFFSGISNASSNSWGNKVTWTLSEPYNAMTWFPVKQILTDKADSAYIYITVDSNLMAGSNGILNAVTDMGNGKKRYEWHSLYPIAYYLLSATVAEYVEYNIYAHPNGTTDALLIQNYVYNNSGCLPYFKNEIDETADCIELLSDLYGLYPFMNEKYGHCMAPFSGGMEHQTMTSLGYFDFGLIIHELGHQWFGDNVTCGTWQDIWINEGFATYTEFLGWQNLKSEAEADSWMTETHNIVMQEDYGSVYVPEADVYNDSRLFDYRLSYKKGASLVHMIRYIIDNDPVFFDVLRTFQEIYTDSTATGDDFKAVLEDVSGISFTDFFNQWYYGDGYPKYAVEWYWQNDTIYINTQQTTTANTPLFTNPLDYRLVKQQGGDTIIRLTQTSNYQQFKVYMPLEIMHITLDPENWVLMRQLSISNNQSVADISNNKLAFTCFPNPAINSVKLEFLEKNNIEKNIEIKDLSGKIIYKEKMNTPKHTIAVNNFSNGMYIISVYGKNLEYHQKLLINH